jgi:nicotinate-nucleotide adenylyltransferase
LGCEKLKRKAIFGGTFDPIHKGHLDIASITLKKLHLDSVIFMPSGNPPFKQNINVTDSSIRYELIKLAIQDEENFSLSPYEINKTGISFTYETLEHFRKEEKDTKWFFLIGSDCFLEIEKWERSDIVIGEGNLVVFNRQGYNKEDVKLEKLRLESKYKREIIFIDNNVLDISSKEIREQINAKLETSNYLTSSVLNRIKELKLYS